MATRRGIALTSASLVTAGAVTLVAAAVATQDDPRVPTGAVVVDGVSVPSATGSVADPGNGQQVAALDRVEGTLERRGDDADDFHVGAVELELGPEAWVVTAGPLEDYDGDGTTEDLLAELEGLVGQPVRAMVRLDHDGDDADVYVLNELPYRDSAGGPAPWQQGATATQGAASPQAVGDAAAAAVGDGARVDELDRQSAGDVAWEAEVVAADGREHTVLLDAGGEVLDVRRDD